MGFSFFRNSGVWMALFAVGARSMFAPIPRPTQKTRHLYDAHGRLLSEAQEALGTRDSLMKMIILEVTGCGDYYRASCMIGITECPLFSVKEIQRIELPSVSPEQILRALAKTRDDKRSTPDKPILDRNRAAQAPKRLDSRENL